MKTPQKTAWRSNTIAEEPEDDESDADAQGNRPHALSASACQQVLTLNNALTAVHCLIRPAHTSPLHKGL